MRLAPSRAGRITATLTAASKGPQHAATAADVLTGGRVLGAAPGQIYWVSQDEIWAAGLDGTSPHAIVTGQAAPAGIAVNSSHLYWADNGDGDGTIWEANLDGTSPHIIFTGQREAGTTTVTPSHIYWANEGGAGDRAGTIWAASLDGSNPHTIVTGQTLPAGVAADASHVYWADDGNERPGNGTISEAIARTGPACTPSPPACRRRSGWPSTQPPVRWASSADGTG